MTTFWVVHGVVTFLLFLCFAHHVVIRKVVSIGDLVALVLAMIPGIAEVMLVAVIWVEIKENADLKVFDWRK